VQNAVTRLILKNEMQCILWTLNTRMDLNTNVAGSMSEKELMTFTIIFLQHGNA
jgi:hypothetical protein